MPLIKDGINQLYKSTLGEDLDEVIIGNQSNFSSFKPIINLSRWNKEEKLGIESKLFNFSNLNFVDGRLLIESNNYGFYFDAKDSENLKFGLILKKKPPTNFFLLQLSNWENFDFLYQPYLANVNPDGSSWENNGRGGQLFRPAGVGGSYAVYHKTKANHFLGSTNYKTGKFGHIYCPKFIDAEGKEEWAILTISNGVYSITIPQTFLDSAAYPVIANDTFGYTSIGASTDNIGNHPTVAECPNAPGSDGSLDSLSFYCNILSGTPEFCPALYSNKTTAGYNQPNARLAYADAGTAIGSSLAWVTTNLSYASIVTGTQYWLGAKSGTNGETLNLRYDAWDPGHYTGYYNAEGAWPDPYLPLDNGIFMKISIYATYTPAGGGRTTKNSRSNPLGSKNGMALRMN